MKYKFTLALICMLGFNCSEAQQEEGEIVYPIRTIKGTGESCPSELSDLLETTRTNISALLKNIVNSAAPCDDRTLGRLERCPAASCRDLYLRGTTSSGRYWVQNSVGSSIRCSVTCPSHVAVVVQVDGHSLLTGTPARAVQMGGSITRLLL